MSKLAKAEGLLPLGARVIVMDLNLEGWVSGRTFSDPMAYDVTSPAGRHVRGFLREQLKLIEAKPLDWPLLPEGLKALIRRGAA